MDRLPEVYGQANVLEVGKDGTTQEFIDSQDGREVPFLDSDGKVVGKVVGKVKLKVAGACLLGDFVVERQLTEIEPMGISAVRNLGNGIVSAEIKST